MYQRPQPFLRQQIYLWLLIGVIMVMIQVILGGITRLTGSGLSITEWDLVTGSLPPLGQQAWQNEFDAYKQTPQFRLLNSDFTLPDFQFIYFWEWFHRLWARLIGLVFAAGFIYFLVRKAFSRALIAPLVVLFLLGALQGAVGWIMVASGLTGDAVYVKPTRLALHFVLALFLLAYTWWFALKLRYPTVRRGISYMARGIIIATLCLLVVQLFYGALMAGHKAASAAPTWPLINGSIFYPGERSASLTSLTTWVGDKFVIHSVHRSTAYVLFVLLMALSYFLYHQKIKKFRLWAAPALLGIIQVCLGIASVLVSPQIRANRWGAFEWLALLHQATAMFIILLLLYFLYHSRHRRQV